MDKRFSFTQSPLSGVWVAERKIHDDPRGVFSRLFCADEFKTIGVIKPIIQINHSITPKKGTARGLHFQYPPHAETKIICCLRGEIFDVAVDLRQRSPTFLSWFGVELSPKNRKIIIIPEGFAHGFQTLSDDCELIYLHTNLYSPKSEGGINVTDQRLKIKWPLPIKGLSPRDQSLTNIPKDFPGIIL